MKPTKIQVRCPQCNMLAHVTSSYNIGSIKFFTYKCGHTVTEKQISAKTEEKRDFIWNNLYPYQREAVEFIENSNFNCLIADPMGAGKTIEVLAALRYNFKELTPVIIVVKSSLKYNWAKEILQWLGKACETCFGDGTIKSTCDSCGKNTTNELITKIFTGVEGDFCSDCTKTEPIKNTCPNCTNGVNNKSLNLKTTAWIVSGGSQLLPKGFNFYIISMDLLPKYEDKIEKLNPKLIIVDESQHFKEMTAKRTISLFEISKKISHKILITGTPILNRAPEYFTSLNLIRPLQWRSYQGFCRTFCQFNEEKQRYTHIHSDMQESFLESTQDYILRRPKSEIMSDLPPFTRNLVILDIEDPAFIKAYEKERRVLEDFINAAVTMSGIERYQHILAAISNLRQIVGLAKVNDCVDYVRSYLAEENGTGKVTIGLHHYLVSDRLEVTLREFKPLVLNGKLSPEKKLDVETEFRENPNRKVLLASTLAAGEGLNFQFCNYAILLERQWNTPKEVQFEGRFHRIGTTKPVTVDYLIARGSVDEWLTQLVESKRQWINTALPEGTGYESEGDPSMDIMELANMCATKRLK